MLETNRLSARQQVDVKVNDLNGVSRIQNQFSGELKLKPKELKYLSKQLRTSQLSPGLGKGEMTMQTDEVALLTRTMDTTDHTGSPYHLY